MPLDSKLNVQDILDDANSAAYDQSFANSAPAPVPATSRYFGGANLSSHSSAYGHVTNGSPATPRIMMQESRTLDDFDRHVLRGIIPGSISTQESILVPERTGLGYGGGQSQRASLSSILGTTSPLIGMATYGQQNILQQPSQRQQVSMQSPFQNNYLYQHHTQLPELPMHRARRFNQPYSQRQQLPPPFNLAGFTNSATIQDAPLSSPPNTILSSPTDRLAIRYSNIQNSRRLAPSRTQPQSHDSVPYTPTRISNSATSHSIPTLDLDHAPPMVQGIQLVSTNNLPDRVRQVFPFQLFNAVQSKCMAAIYKRDDNVVVCAPTGSGKTALLELAICKLIEGHVAGQFKIVYQAPTKSLCSERVRDWKKKFEQLNLECAELTGDTDVNDMKRVASASIIVTTPEKWDSITRKWKDHIKLLQMVKLFLIDEVHILKDNRGATLEAVVSRMKSIGTDVRFVALSATVPNSQDIATWLGKNSTSGHLPAHREVFGESFRPVKLQKHVYGFESGGNDFSFDAILDGKLPTLVAKHTSKKPMMVFCFTRKSCEVTAAKLAEWWESTLAKDRAWPAPTQKIPVLSNDLAAMISKGVAFHHAGLEAQDRLAVESGFLSGQIFVIVCTSTLAVGVNLPCHLVVIKGTLKYCETGPIEYSDLEVMQMLGRAGRPQFDSTAVAIIMTRKAKSSYYEKMVSGQEVLESTLHHKLIEHLNSEIGLRTVYDLYTAKQWINGTFLSVRIRQNPSYYKFDCDGLSKDTDDRLEAVCERDIKLLQTTKLITSDQNFMCTEYGEAMSRYMVPFETMKLLLGIPEKAKISQMLHIICQAPDFKEIRLKANERNYFRELNKSPFIKFPIKEQPSTGAHKISLIVQAQLGGADMTSHKDAAILRRQNQTDKMVTFDVFRRLVRCVVDCKVHDNDAVATRHALELARSISAEHWENSHQQLIQIPALGPVAARKLVQANIRTVAQLSGLGSADIERILSRNPPFGVKVRDSVMDFPNLTLQASMLKPVLKAGQPVKIQIRARLGYGNTKLPLWKGHVVLLNFFAEVSSGSLAHLWRGNSKHLEKDFIISFTAELKHAEDFITCWFVCEEIVGTIKSVELRHEIPAAAFPAIKQKSKAALGTTGFSRTNSDDDAEFELDGDLADDDLVEAMQSIEGGDHLSQIDEDGFIDIDAINSEPEKEAAEIHQPVQLSSGRWKCNHVCAGGQTKNGKICKHKCCHQGLEHPVKSKKKVVKKTTNLEPRGRQPDISKFTGMESKSSTMKKASKPELHYNSSLSSTKGDIEVIDLSGDQPYPSYGEQGPLEYRKLHALHSKIQKGGEASTHILKTKPIFSYKDGKIPELSFLSATKSRAHDEAAYGEEDADEEMPTVEELVNSEGQYEHSPHTFQMCGSTSREIEPDTFESSPKDLEAGMLSLNGAAMDQTSSNYTGSSLNSFTDDQGVHPSEQLQVNTPFLIKTKGEYRKRKLADLSKSDYGDEEIDDNELMEMNMSRLYGPSPSNKSSSLENSTVATTPGSNIHENFSSEHSLPDWVKEFEDQELVKQFVGIVEFEDE